MYQWTELMQHFVVCILQYFLWYLCLLPLILPRLKLCKIEGLILIVMWLAGQVSSMSTLFSVISTYILSTIFKEFFRNLSHYRLSTNELGLQLTHLFRHYYSMFFQFLLYYASFVICFREFGYSLHTCWSFKDITHSCTYGLLDFCSSLSICTFFLDY